MYISLVEKLNVYIKNEGFKGRAKKLAAKGLLSKLPVFEIFFFELKKVVS